MPRMHLKWVVSWSKAGDYVQEKLGESSKWYGQFPTRKRTSKLLERFNALSVDERIELLNAAMCLSGMADRLMGDQQVDLDVEAPTSDA